VAGFSLCVVLALVAPHPLLALDDLFDDPDRGVVEEGEAIGDETDPGRDPESDEEAPPEVLGVDIAALTTSPPRFSGSVNTGAGIAMTLREWPGTDAAEDEDFQDLFTGSAGYDMSTTLSLTARPRPYLRFTAAMTTSLNQNTGRFNNPSMGNVFVDYTFRETYYMRVGSYGMTWGQARLLSNIGNLASHVSDGASMRLTVAAGPGTVTGVITARGSDDPRDFAYAGQYETTRGRVSTGVAGRARRETTLDTAAYMTLGLGAVDLTQEGLVRWDRDDPFSESTLNFATLSQVVWEFGNPVWRLIGEYEFDYAVEDLKGHRTGVAVRMPQFLPANWRPQMTWRHAYADNSGQFITAFSGSLGPSLDGTIAIPVNYGDPGTIYRGGEELEGEDEDERQYVSTENFISVLFGIRLKFSF
jgi:hypothetical protein